MARGPAGHLRDGRRRARLPRRRLRLAVRGPRGRRRWCSMAWCGNREKVRAHAARQRAPR
ncbi:CGNR zinc finger domain-containing protein [Luedemannella flava]